MNREELKAEYDSGQLDRPARLRHLRGDIEQHTGLTVPRNIGEIREWWDKNKAVLARKLNEEDAESDEDEPTEIEEEETNDE